MNTYLSTELIQETEIFEIQSDKITQDTGLPVSMELLIGLLDASQVIS